MPQEDLQPLNKSWTKCVHKIKYGYLVLWNVYNNPNKSMSFFRKLFIRQHPYVYIKVWKIFIPFHCMLDKNTMVDDVASSRVPAPDARIFIYHIEESKSFLYNIH